MSTKYLDSTGLAYFWGKLKAYFQPKLVSGTNIKTINNTSLLGSGNITVGGSGTPTPTASTVAEFDSSAHMNSTDMTTGADSELEDFIDGLNVGGGADLSGTKTYNANNGTVRVDWYKTLRVVYVVLTIRPSSAWATGSGNRITCTLDSDIPLPTNFVSGAEINGIACMILNNTSFRAQNNTGSSLAKDSNYNISLTYFT